ETLLSFQTPAVPPPVPQPREAFGLSTQHNLYVCAQQLGKFHPDFDPILGGILERDPAGVVVVAQDRAGGAATALMRRWAAVLPDVADRIVFLPRLETNDYLSLLLAADVLLDPLHFNGVNSTYDGISMGKPIVTMPSGFHRGRYTYACYQRMEMTDCVVTS